MGKSFDNQEEIFASDLLTTQANALMLNGLTSDSFLRADITSGPWIDNSIELGTVDSKFENFWTYKINGNDFSYIMFTDRTNEPIVNSDGTSGFDLGSFSYYWRSMFTRSLYADKIFTSNLLKPDGSKFSHNELSDIGTYKHIEIDEHLNQTNLPHGATTTNVANRLVARDGSGDIRVGTMYGIATTALYADLAEVYTTNDINTLEGTVFKMSTDEHVDVEICNEDLCKTVVGVYSLRPAFLMNREAEGLSIGLKGKVPCRVIGSVNKGDILVSTKNGCLRKATPEEYIYKVAYANETCTLDGENLIMCII